jgi:hypothetical protein
MYRGMKGIANKIALIIVTYAFVALEKFTVMDY